MPEAIKFHEADNGLCVVKFLQNAPRTAWKEGTVAGFARPMAEHYCTAKIGDGPIAEPWFPPSQSAGNPSAARRI